MPIFDDYGAKRPRMPSMRGRVVYRVVNGQVQVQAWPRKAGPPKTEEHQFRVDKFRNVAKVIKYIDPEIQRQFREAVAGTPLLPGDLITAMVYNRLSGVLLPDGTKLYPMPARQDVSASLDALSQLQGYMLIRGEDFWVGLPPGETGQMLQWQADGMPAWVDAGGSTGGTGAVVARTTAQSIAHNTVTSLSFDSVEHADTGFFNPATPTDLVAPSTGLYLASTFSGWAASGVGRRNWFVSINGTAYVSDNMETNSNFTNPTRTQQAAFYLNAGDIVTFRVSQTRGSALNINAGARGALLKLG